MVKFARLIELESGVQVLLTLNYNYKDDNYELSIRTDLEDCVAQIKLGFAKEEKAVNILETFSHDEAIKFRSKMMAMLNYTT